MASRVFCYSRRDSLVGAFAGGISFLDDQIGIVGRSVNENRPQFPRPRWYASGPGTPPSGAAG
ncbi:hypothetical protein [Sporomusa sp.]|uniref:hypothetical protein n=1 Tax=Sporomusa sp. TaxID=2078658 RepID=UPI002D803F3B|nr:hypothetical protein [Sporomusa sp.]